MGFFVINVRTRDKRAQKLSSLREIDKGKKNTNVHGALRSRSLSEWESVKGAMNENEDVLKKEGCGQKVGKGWGRVSLEQQRLGKQLCLGGGGSRRVLVCGTKVQGRRGAIYIYIYDFRDRVSL